MVSPGCESVKTEAGSFVNRTQSFSYPTAIVSLFTRLLQIPLGVSLLMVALPVTAQTAPAVPAESSVSVRSSTLPFFPPELPPIKPVLPESLTVRLVLKLGERRVYVYEGNEVKARYSVAIGRPGWETPTGSFTVMQKLEHPGWTNPLTGEQMPPGNDNPLGDRWIGFWTDGLNWIGFHGTPNRESIGRAASHGCVRMYNEDVRKLYELVQVGTPVTVEP